MLKDATASQTSHACRASQCRAHRSLPCEQTAEKVDVSTGVCEALAVLRLVVEILEMQVHVHESFALLVVPALELVVGLVPRVVAVSLVQCKAHGVPDWSPAIWMRGTAPGRCWVDIELEGRLQPVAI